MTQPSATFWQNPPWANAKGGYQMGLVPIDPDEWCKTPITPVQRDAKLALLNTNYLDVVQATPESGHAQQLLLAAIEQRHNTAATHAEQQKLEQRASHGPPAQPIITAALCVPADLCVLERRGDQYELVAGCVTAPSYWRLSDKLGKSLWAVHNNVPGLNAALGQSMQNFFSRLPTQHCLMRRNWFLHGSNDLFQPDPEHRQPITTALDAEQLTVRSETQTLRRLSEKVIVFTIAVACYPLREIRTYPAAAEAMYSALASRNTQERLAASQSGYEQGVRKFLEQCFL